MKKDYDSNTQTKNKYGEWVPAIPLPFADMLSAQCDCGAKFWGFDKEEKYEGHYALRHILGL